MSDAQKLTRPPESGPGSAREAWVVYAAQELDLPESDFADKTAWTREKLIELVDSAGGESPEWVEADEEAGVRVVPEEDATKLRKAPEGVRVAESPKDVKDALGRNAWAVPVEGGYAAENEITETEK
jgi:hypothetical protein